MINLKLPDYQLVNLSVGVNWQNGFEYVVYVSNVFDENPLL